MKLDLSKVEISRKDRNLGMTFPKELTKELAYLIGIHLGDGTMNHYTKYYYSIGYSGHAIDELDFYNKQINALFYKFFNKKLNFYKKKSKTGEYIELATQSKGIFTFFKTSLGIMPGPKTHNKIPEIIKYSNFKVYFIRGFADSDFTLTFKKRNKDLHYYPVISLSTSNKLLLLEVNSLLDDLGLISCLTLDLPTKRYDKSHITHQMDINGEKMLAWNILLFTSNEWSLYFTTLFIKRSIRRTTNLSISAVFTSF